jgi:peptidyl-prolyl cis-trans isomerase C
MAVTTALRSAFLAGLAAVALAGAGGLAGCGGPHRAETAPERGDVAVAKVDGKTVWASDVKREAIAQGLIGEGEPLELTADLFHRVLGEVVDQKLLAAEAVRRKIDKDPVAQRRLAAARDRVLGDMLVEAAVTDAVTDSAVKGLYDEQLKLARRSEEVHARQIVLASAADAEAVKKLLAAGASFEGLAMERSQDAATRFNGGDLGYFTVDVMPEAYATVLAGVAKGAVVGPFRVENGFVVLKVEDRRIEAPIAMEAARPQIVRFLTYDQIRDLLEKLRSQAKIETLVKQDPATVSPPPADASASAPVSPSATGAAR